MQPKNIFIVLLVAVFGALAIYYYFVYAPFSQERQKQEVIRVDVPKPNQEVSSPIFISGEARGGWFFEASFGAKILDGNRNIILQFPITTPLNWMTNDFVAFNSHVEFEKPSTQKGFLVLEKANPSGLSGKEDSLVIPIKFAEPPKDITQVKVHFNVPEEGQPDCAKTFAVTRAVPKTQAVAKAALEELLKGPTQIEAEKFGVFSSINPGVKLQSIVIQDGLARADFDEQLQFQVGGSCKVQAIRAQLTNTLKEFPSVKEVLISINGRTQDILQP